MAQGGFYNPQMDRGAGKSQGKRSAILVNNQNRKEQFVFLIIGNLIFPAVLFSVLLFIICSEWRYTDPHLLGGSLAGSIIVLIVGIWFIVFVTKKFHSFAFLCTVGVIAGVGVGEFVYRTDLLPVYTMTAMRERTNVDPAQTPGDSIRDTGRVYFSEGSKVDTMRGMSYKTYDTYCVAPITTGIYSRDIGPETLNSYGYWAIGTNCCSSADPNFQRCGQSVESLAGVNDHAGLRLMFPEQVPYFKLAVEQAEAEFNIKATENPLFFYWVADPLLETANFERQGFNAKISWAFFYTSFNLVFGCALTYIMK